MRPGILGMTLGEHDQEIPTNFNDRIPTKMPLIDTYFWLIFDELPDISLRG